MTTQEEMIDNLGRTLDRLESQFEIYKRRAETAEAELKRINKQPTDDDDDMECSECGADVPSDASHCPECGAELSDDDDDDDEAQSSQLKRIQSGHIAGHARQQKGLGGGSSLKKNFSKYASGAIDISKVGDADTVEKCLRAVAKGDYEYVTKADFEAALNQLTQERLRRKKSSNIAKHYSKVLATPRGAALYSGYVAAPDAPPEYSANPIVKNTVPVGFDYDAPNTVIQSISKGHSVSREDCEAALDALCLGAIEKRGGKSSDYYSEYAKMLQTNPAAQAIYYALDQIIRREDQ